MSRLAEEIVTQGYCLDGEGQPIRLHSHTTIEQCRFLMKLMDEVGPADSLEVGLAYGISALYAAEHAARHGRAHIIIDPFQHGRAWQGVGLANLERAGLRSSCRFIEDDARLALPRLLSDGQEIGFAYIDASKRMDDMLIMFHFIFKMMKLGGIVAFDDVAWFPGISDALRYIVQMPGVEVHAVCGPVRPTLRRRAMRWAASTLPAGRRLFAPEWTRPAPGLDISAGCVALRKVSEDTGDWAWHPS